MKTFVGVIGDAYSSPEFDKIAEEVGKEIALKGGILVCGGLKGVMEAACRGAKSVQGTTVGILPGSFKREANSYVDIPIATGLDQARNVIIVRTSDVVIAIGGGFGTLSEIAYCLKLNVPVIAIKSYLLEKEGKKVQQINYVDDAKQAVEKAFSLVLK